MFANQLGVYEGQNAYRLITPDSREERANIPILERPMKIVGASSRIAIKPIRVFQCVRRLDLSVLKTWSASFCGLRL